jgi:hypothetical protein
MPLRFAVTRQDRFDLVQRPSTYDRSDPFRCCLQGALFWRGLFGAATSQSSKQIP